MMRQAIENFPKQFLWEPEIKNAESFRHRKKAVVLGMGGSHLAADLIASWKPEIFISIHESYGLPCIPVDEYEQTLVIASSYSGTTVEVLDGYAVARKKKIPLLALSIGGELLEMAKKDGTPYIQLPDTGIQPRSAIGFSFKALLKALGEERALEEVREAADDLRGEKLEKKGKELAEKLFGKVPVIYASLENKAVAKIWKIKLNEGAKIPAYWNFFPELNHNEMTGFDIVSETKDISKNTGFVFLKDPHDDPRIGKRMEITKRLFEDRGLPVETINMGSGAWPLKTFSSLVLADWVSLCLAELYGVPAEEVPMIEEFKKKL